MFHSGNIVIGTYNWNVSTKFNKHNTKQHYKIIDTCKRDTG